MSDTTVRPDSGSNSGSHESETPSSIIAHQQAPPKAVRDTPAESRQLAAVEASLATPSTAYESPYDTRGGMGEVMKYLISFLVLGAGFGIMFGLWMFKKSPEGQVSKELVPMVGTVAAEPFTGQLDIVISGTVVPFREIRVAAEVGGNIIKKYDACEAGNFVKKGTKLLDIDPLDYKLELKTREAEVNQAQKMLEETRQEMIGVDRNIVLAKRDFDLSKEDWERNQRIKSALSSSELDQSKRNFLNAETALTGRENNLNMLTARFARLEAAIALSQAQLERSKLNLSKTTIVAPDDGVIVREVVQEGENVSPGAQLIMFEDTSRAEVVCNLTATDLAWIRDHSSESEMDASETEAKEYSVYHLPKTHVTVFEPGQPEIFWDGILERFDGIGREQATRTIPARITIKKPIVDAQFGKRALVRGMYVKCQVEVDASKNAANRKFLSLPTLGLRSGNHVWVVRDNLLVRVPVVVVDYAEFTKDGATTKVVVVHEEKGLIESGDLIVTTPLSQPTNGMTVLLESDVNAEASKGEDVSADPDR